MVHVMHHAPRMLACRCFMLDESVQWPLIVKVIRKSLGCTIYFIFERTSIY